jgi:hypothetical protein
MGKRSSNQGGREWLRVSLVVFLVITSVLSAIFQGVLPNTLPLVHAQTVSDVGTIAPSTNWGPFVGTYGDVQVNINQPGIAVRVEIPREFLQGVISTENDTHFIQSDIRNDYYYYNVVDESNHWTYDWRGSPSDGPCFKPNFSLRDPNAPWCVEIWNYLNDPNYKAPAEDVDYCAIPPPTRYVFSCFSPPKFIRFRNLNSPSVAGIYNFTIFVANRTNSVGYPDFVHAWNTTLFVPVSMSDDPGTINGIICDADRPSTSSCPYGDNPPILHHKGVVYARNVDTGQIARAYVNQATGGFNLTGLAPGNYEVQGSAGFADGVAYSLSDPVETSVTHGNPSFVTLNLNRAPQVCGSISYDASPGTPLGHSFSDNANLKTVFGPGSDQRISLNITVEAIDSQGHVYRFVGTSSNSSSDSFSITTGSNVTYVGTDPYGTEYAGLPPISSGPYTLTVNIWVTGYVEEFSDRSVTVSSAPGSSIPTNCGDPGTNAVPGQVSTMLMGSLITGMIKLEPCQNCQAETPNQAMDKLGLGSVTGPLFGGNILIEAYDQSGTLRGVAVNGTTPTLSGDVSSLSFYVIGFSEYANHTRSGVWDESDYGLSQGQYYLQIYIRGYEQASSPTFSVPQGGVSNGGSIIVPMVRGGVFQTGVGSFDNRFGTSGTCTIQSSQRWRFLNLPIPIRARVYYYDSSGILVGFSETVMATGVPGGVGQNSFTVLFSGQNWSTREIWFYGYVPTHVTNQTYSIKAFTLGYVQCLPVNVPNDLASFAQASVALLIANDIDLTGVPFNDPNTLSNIAEHDHAIAEASGITGLEGALPANVSANVPTLSLQISGFGAWENISCVPPPCRTSFLGQGHFFYVSPDGARYLDYGLNVGNYTTQVPEFGFNFHLMQSTPPTAVSFTDLSQEEGIVASLLTMGIIFGGSPFVTGYATSDPTGPGVPLSWVQVQATSPNFTQWIPTLDGEYAGVGALFLPEGIYNITFSVAFYKSQTRTGVQVAWGQSQPVLPPDPPLCPTEGITGVCDPPLTPASAQSQAFVSVLEPLACTCISRSNRPRSYP